MEDQIRKKANSAWKWILGIALMLVLLVLACYVTVFHVNRFSLALQLQGEQEIILEYGQQYEEPGAQPILSGTMFWKDGIVPENTPVQIESDLRLDKLGKYTVTYSTQLEDISASA